MSPMATIFTILLPFLVFFLLSRAFTLKRRLPLLPGSISWPYFSETFQLYPKNPHAFFTIKQRRYGSIFKSHILGCPCVMVTSPEAAKFALVSSAHLFKPTFPASKERMMGPRAIFFQQGEYHARLRKVVQRVFMPDAIRGSVCGTEEIAADVLKSLEGRKINTFHEMKTYAFSVALISISGKEEISYVEELKQCYRTLEKGYNSLAINTPGTLFYIGSFMQTDDLTDNQITDNIIGVLFAARDTTASVLTWIIKFLGENPAILEAVTETMRVASVLSFTFREAVEDVEYEGYLIPKGWKVLPLFRNIHHNEEYFHDPDKFDPSRFHVAPKPNTFLPYGSGALSCPGNELARLEV